MGLLIALIITWSSLVSAQIQQAWVAKYNNSITNGNHQALKMALDPTGNIYVLGVSANDNTNIGYVVVKYAPNGNQIWSARYDSTNFPTATPTGFALDSSNAVVVTGNAVTAKYDASGNQLWTLPYSANGIGMDLGQNAYITGTSNAFTTIKLNPQGSNVWTRTFGESQDISEAIAIDSSSNVFIAGKEITQSRDAIAANVATVKYDKDGTQLWANVTMDGNLDYDVQIPGVALDKADNIYIEENYLGTFVGPYSTDKYSSDGVGGGYAGNPTQNILSAASAIALDSVGGILVTGKNAHQPPLPSYGTYKMDIQGNYLWTNLYPMSSYGSSGALGIAVDSNDSVYVTGESTITNTGSDIATIKYDSNGKQLWLQRYDGPAHENDAGNVIAVDNSGNVYVAGYETETNGFTSMILIKYSLVIGQKQSNGDFILHASGSPGESFDIQASTNLQTWQDLGSIIADTNGVALFEDTNAPLFPARFYYTIPK
jgi:hypothetical protein